MHAADLERFVAAQDEGGSLRRALAELRAGQKRGHWVWYVFPQLRGLGSSSAAVTYGIDGIGEARAYAEHPVLRARLLDAIACVQARRDVPLERLMGSRLDAVKLVSCLTLFARSADAEVAGRAEEALRRAESEGFTRCSFTLAAIG